MPGKRKEPRILLTGAGSAIGFGLAKALKSYRGLGEVILANVNDSYPARALFPTGVTTPDFYFRKTGDEAEFSEALLTIVHAHGVNIILSASIFELAPLSGIAPRLTALGCQVIVEDLHTIQTFSDKLATILTLKELAIPCPETEELRRQLPGHSALPNIALPFIIKPRFGYGSRGVAIIKDERGFKDWDARQNNRYAPFVVQEYLPREDAEYSCTITACAAGDIKDCMAIGRLKVRGVTTAARYDTACIPVERALLTYGARLRPRFCLNLQCRIKDSLPYIFEINPRFGAAEPIRVQFGFDAFHSVLSEYAHVDQAAEMPRRFGIVYREYAEIFLAAAEERRA